MNLEEIATEELTPAEVREVLTRLAVNEFGGDDQATVATVAEVAGTSALVVGRLLAEIRHRSLDERFGSRLREYETRLVETQAEVSKLKAVKREDDSIQKELRDMARERIASRKYSAFIGISTIMLILLIAMIMTHR